MSNLGFEFDHRWQDFDTRPDGSIADPGWLATAEVRDAQLEDYLSLQASATSAGLDALDTRVDVLEATDITYDGRLDALEAADVSLDSRIDVIEADYVRKRVAGAATGSAQTGITTITDLTNLSVTFTALAGRRYNIVAKVNFRQISAAGLVTVEIVSGASTVLDSWIGTFAAAAYGTAKFEVDAVPGAGSVTFKLRASTSGGTLDVNQIGSSTVLSSIKVWDGGSS